MATGFCPKCGGYCFAYDQQDKVSRCYNPKCEFVDTKKQYGNGLSENPFVRRGPDGMKLPDKMRLEGKLNSA